jgi:hypothetical protein
MPHELRRAAALLAIVVAARSGVAEPEATTLPPRRKHVRMSWEPGAGSSHLIPMLDTAGFDFLVNRVGGLTTGSDDYAVTPSSVRHNLTSHWVIDHDPFAVNQFLHPLQGATYHGFARSSGLGYWASLGHAFAGSAMWEIAGETTPPSWNDQVTTGIGGTFLGEPLFRTASLLLERGRERPGAWREIGAAAIAPSLGFNRLAYGNRFDAVFPGRDPACFVRVQAGVNLTTTIERGLADSFERNEVIADVSMDYGLPGKPGYRHSRPFDYFSLQVGASSANGFESILTRGLIVGRDVEHDDGRRGAWGLFGSYDYVAPQVFRVSSTALSIGRVDQWWLTDAISIQGSVTGGLGFAAASSVATDDGKDYHHGLAPQFLVTARLNVGTRFCADATVRDWFVTHVASAGGHGTDNVARANASLTVRLRGRQAISLRYAWTRRDGDFPDRDGVTQSRGTVGLTWTLLSDEHFGAVEWRRP